MGAGTKHARDELLPVSLALSLTTANDSPTTSCTTSADSSSSSGAPPVVASPATRKKRARRGRVVATSGEGEFVCKTCGRAFASFQALGGHRTSHLRRGRHGLDLGLAKDFRDKKKRLISCEEIKDKEKQQQQEQHECHVCGLGFETGQALGGHMSRHRDEMALNGGADERWVWRSVKLLAGPDEEVEGHRRPVLLDLFV